MHGHSSSAPKACSQGPIETQCHIHPGAGRPSLVPSLTLTLTREALATASSARAWGGPGEADDERRAEALCRAVAPLLACRGFPGTALGLRSFAAAARAAGSQRAAASLGRLWHAAPEPGPLILTPATPAAPSPPDAAAARTLIVAFSSLGWHGLVRAEWGATLRGAAAGEGLSAVVDVAYALDTACSWFTTDPITGAYDDGAWWDAALLELCAPYDRVCLLGESMGGSAALRFAQHATSTGAVVALAPQVDLRDFACCGRVDFSDDRKVLLREAIAAAVDNSRAPVTLHVGRDADDLQQLNHLAGHMPSLAAAFEAAGEQAETPLERDGVTPRKDTVGGGLIAVKHDVEGHAVGAALSARNTLKRTIRDDIFGGSSSSASLLTAAAGRAGGVAAGGVAAAGADAGADAGAGAGADADAGADARRSVKRAGGQAKGRHIYRRTGGQAQGRRAGGPRMSSGAATAKRGDNQPTRVPGSIVVGREQSIAVESSGGGGGAWAAAAAAALQQHGYCVLRSGDLDGVPLIL